ncbi:hypothetical protein BEN49_03805 [Hymenobacter coccineus]|uniref:CobQ/CobB/MinD/ParA nucleotide binding domain-containing protein n=1 Tax=Hymenobacter coccineus TaxID=1908235 RepID=A0A1G1TM36_9BACT|nr:hypothetical protein BEN49_03805 [Hymenobacter coccineus]
MVGVALALLAAYAYNQLAQPTYEVQASILVEEGNKQPGERSALQELDFANGNNVLESEMEILRSRRLMQQVVQTLGLSTVYQRPGRFSAQDLYGKSPVQLTFLHTLRGQHVLNIVLQDTASFAVRAADGTLTRHAFGRPISDSLGTWQLNATASLRGFEGGEVRIRTSSPEAVVQAYQKLLDIELINKVAPAIRLQIKDQVPQRGIDVLNQLIAAYNNASATEKNKLTANALQFIDSRLGSLRGELNQAESAVTGYRSQQGLADVASQSQIVLENTQANDTRLNTAQVQLAVVESIERYLRNPQPAATVPTTLGITDEALNNLVGRLTSLQLQRETLLTTTPAGNPLFKPLDSEIQTTQLAIRTSVQNIKASLLTTIRELRSFNSGFKSSIKSMPGQEQQLVNRKRQLTIKENLYNYLLQKREEAALSYAATLTNSRTIDSAYVLPSRLASRWLSYLVALVLGLVVPAGLLQAQAGLSTRLTTRAEIEAATRVPVLAELALDERDQVGLGALQAPSVLAEQLRGLRTRLMLAPPSGPAASQVVLVTSSVSGEGKSFLSAHLAASFAQAGHATVLVDLDLRRPKLSHRLGLSGSHLGASDFLAGQADWPATVQPTAISPNLSFIGSGTQLATPDLLEGPQLAKLLAELRGAYRHIVLDSPPLHLVADALLLAQASDCTLYVVRQGVTNQEELGFIEELRQQEQLPKLRLIFNGIDSQKFGYGYQYDNQYLRPA